MEKYLTTSQMRTADAYTINDLGIPSETLMFRAGSAIAERAKLAFDTGKGKTITIVCGTGNNGGDGYVCARLLKEGDYPVKVYAIDGNLSADCEREKFRYDGEYASSIEGIVVDCIFGTGLSREVSGKYLQVINAINKKASFVISVDIPSGLNGDNGLKMGVCVLADETVAIAENKLGYILGEGIDASGKIIKIDIGITLPNDVYATVYANEDISAFYPKRKRNSHKGTYGTVNVIAGCKKYRGAAALCTEAALRSGCGYVKLTSVEEVKNSLVKAYPQAIYLDEVDLSANCITIGSGCGKSKELYERIKFILNDYEGKLVIDADGLNVLAEYGVDVLDNKKCQVLVTPHIGEFSRLTGLTSGEIAKDPVARAREFAKAHNITVLLKNAVSVITDGRDTVINTRGTTALAKGGSGDILTGLIGGNTARGLSLFHSAVCSAYLLGASAELCSEELTDYCTTAKDILKKLPKSVKSLTF